MSEYSSIQKQTESYLGHIVCGTAMLTNFDRTNTDAHALEKFLDRYACSWSRVRPILLKGIRHHIPPTHKVFLSTAPSIVDLPILALDYLDDNDCGAVVLNIDPGSDDEMTLAKSIASLRRYVQIHLYQTRVLKHVAVALHIAGRTPETEPSKLEAMIRDPADYLGRLLDRIAPDATSWYEQIQEHYR